MICKNCSTNFDDNAPYCPYCGAPNDMLMAANKAKMNIITLMHSRAVNIITTVSRIRSNLIINISSRI